MPQIGMGRGLSALLPDRKNDLTDLREIPTELIEPNPRQPRETVDEDELGGLAASISERGVIQPVIVVEKTDGNYELIAGERRWRAAIKAGLKQIPALVHEGKDDSESNARDSLELAMIENMVREDLNPIEEARACAALVDELGIKVEEVGRKVGRSRSAVSNMIRLLELPDEVIEAVRDGRLSEGHGRAILQSKDQNKRREIARKVVRDQLTVRETERLAKSADDKKRDDAAVSAPVQLHPELEQSRCEAEDALADALGVEARVKIRGRGARVELVFDDVRDIIGLAKEIELRKAA